MLPPLLRALSALLPVVAACTSSPQGATAPLEHPLAQRPGGSLFSANTILVTIDEELEETLADGRRVAYRAARPTYIGVHIDEDDGALVPGLRSDLDPSTFTTELCDTLSRTADNDLILAAIVADAGGVCAWVDDDPDVGLATAWATRLFIDESAPADVWIDGWDDLDADATLFGEAWEAVGVEAVLTSRTPVPRANLDLGPPGPLDPAVLQSLSGVAFGMGVVNVEQDGAIGDPSGMFVTLPTGFVGLYTEADLIFTGEQVVSEVPTPDLRGAPLYLPANTSVVDGRLFQGPAPADPRDHVCNRTGERHCAG